MNDMPTREHTPHTPPRQEIRGVLRRDQIPCTPPAAKVPATHSLANIAHRQHLATNPPGAASKLLFEEGIALFLRAMHERNMLIGEQRELFLLAINGLISLGNYRYARALIRMGFSDLSADDFLRIMDEAKHTQANVELTIPF